MGMLVNKFAERHVSVLSALRWLEPNKNLPDGALRVASLYAGLASDLMDRIKDGPELTIALRTLCQSKDEAIRALLASQDTFQIRPAASEV
jgi:hypothetical protein